MEQFASEVAREFGMSFAQLQAECREGGHHLSTANDVIPLPRLEWLRRKFASSGDAGAKSSFTSDDWQRGVDRAQRNSRRAARSRPPKYGRQHPPPATIRVALDYAVTPRRSRGNQRPADVWTHEEISRAEQIARDWTNVWLSGYAAGDFDVSGWLKAARGERPDLAARLSTVGITPAEAQLRLHRTGVVDHAVPALFVQVVNGLPIDVAARRVLQYRAQNQARA